jgi:3-hydroxyisobutyrate dehydrogenase-like beta-hydroxyacid dehydrogenase
MSERIGFVGLGIMGLAMARNLANAGFELTAFNRTSTKAEEERALGDFLMDELYSFVGEGWEQEDDITLLTLKRSASLS